MTELMLPGRTCPGSGSMLRLGGPDWYCRSMVFPAVEVGKYIILCIVTEKPAALGQISLISVNVEDLCG